MAMYNTKLQKQVKKMFRDLRSKSDDIIASSSIYKTASDRIMNMVSSKVAAESEGYVIDMYTSLVEQIKKEDFFRDPDHLNRFYRLNLREELNNRYHFEINSLDAYKKGINYKEVNQLYASLGTAAGTLAVGGILKFTMSSVVNIPFALIIAGAIASACTMYFKMAPIRNKKEFQNSVNKFLSDLENDILNWLADIEKFFNNQVRTLYSQNSREENV